MTTTQMFESVPIGFKFTLPSGNVIERRADGTYLNGEPMPKGPYFGCETAQDYQRRAAALTNKVRKEKTRHSIVMAISFLKETRQPLNVTNVAKVANVSRQAIYANHADLIP